jgi:RNA polymerase sigma-70 factor (ECF subfamily)
MPPSLTTTDPRFAQIESHRPYLVRYALAQLRDATLAEEAVQEALVAALEGIDGFAGKSSLRTWLTSILRYKVADLQRRAVAERARIEVADESAAAGEDGAWLDEWFDDTGHWRSPPQAWGDPEATFEQQRFWQVFDRCLDGLPPTGARVFFKREVMGEDTEEICGAERITPSNCWVILHRARLALRMCLEKNWFGEDGRDGR